MNSLREILFPALRRGGRPDAAPVLTVVGPLRKSGAASAAVRNRAGLPEWPDDLVEDYLDHLYAPLVGVVPYAERSNLRAEAAYHLDRLVSDGLVEGLAKGDAVRAAIDRYGASGDVAQQFLDAWFRHQAQGRFARWIGLDHVRALTWFGLATLLCTTLVHLRILWPDPEPIMFGLSLAQVRRIIPAPLPLPDGSPVSVTLFFTALAAPFVAGWLTGVGVPVKPARAVYHVQVLLTLYTFVFGILMLPVRTGLFLAVFELFFWLPVGCLTAQVALAIMWRRRLQSSSYLQRAARG